MLLSPIFLIFIVQLSLVIRQSYGFCDSEAEGRWKLTNFATLLYRYIWSKGYIYIYFKICLVPFPSCLGDHMKYFVGVGGASQKFFKAIVGKLFFFFFQARFSQAQSLTCSAQMELLTHSLACFALGEKMPFLSGALPNIASCLFYPFSVGDVLWAFLLGWWVCSPPPPSFGMVSLEDVPFQESKSLNKRKRSPLP